MAETTKHTPGPWNISQQNIREIPGHRGMYEVPIRFSTGNHIATVYLGGPGATNADRDSVVANARLIAAAPALLEACNRLIESMHANSTRCGFGRKFTPRNNPCDCNHHAWYHAARAAIALAEGGA